VPAGAPNFTIPNPFSEINVIDSSNFPTGLYIFKIYASDSQNVPYTFFNVTFVANIIQAVLPNDFQVQFTPYCGSNGEDPDEETACGPPGTVPVPNILLNGTGTTESNKNITLFFLWQVSNEEITQGGFCDSRSPNCVFFTEGLFNYTEPIAYLVPNLIGLYTVNLTVTDGMSYSSALMNIFVVPNFTTPEGPPLVLPNYTSPPLRNFTFDPLPILNFTNETAGSNTSAPVLPVPTTNTTVPPLIERFPGPTTAEWILIFFMIFAFTVELLIILAYWIYLQPLDKYNYSEKVVFELQ
jgi:hypothetical protein